MIGGADEGVLWVVVVGAVVVHERKRLGTTGQGKMHLGNTNI